jgi:hypothetical protein
LNCSNSGLAHLANRTARRRRFAANFFFDAIQSADAGEGFSGGGRRLKYMNIVELAPRMSPAGYLVDNTAIVKMMKASVGVRLQSTLKVFQMLARMLALAIS